MKPRVCVLRAPGTNCDLETAYAFESAGAIADRLHLFRLLEQPKRLLNYQVLCIPGGFSYGDDIGAGVIFGKQLNGQLAETMGEFLAHDRLVLGICNGFQVLMKSGILPGGSTTWPPSENFPQPATLTWNRNGKYTSLWVNLKSSGSNSVFLRDIEFLELPIAHAEGRIALRSADVLDIWRSNRQVALEYVASGEATTIPAHRSNFANGSAAIGAVTASTVSFKEATTSAVETVWGATIGAAIETHASELLPYPFNPNGSVANIAGLSDPTGRVLGLMPHPERFLFATQHPRWTRTGRAVEGDGMRLFRNAVEYFTD